jgi:hypothetical protein
VAQSVVRIVLESYSGGWVPLGVFLGETLLGIGFYSKFLALAQLADKDVVVLMLAVFVSRVVLLTAAGHGDHPGVAGVQVGRGDIAGLVVVAPHVQRELHRALLTKVGACAVPAVLHVVHSLVGGQGNETQTVGDEFVGQDGAVGLQLHPVDGDGGRLGDHHATNRVGHAEVSVFQLELDQLIADICDKMIK